MQKLQITNQTTNYKLYKNFVIHNEELQNMIKTFCHQTSRSTGYKLCFIFEKSRVRLFARKLAIMTEDIHGFA
jgi:hypothetical protein